MSIHSVLPGACVQQSRRHLGGESPTSPQHRRRDSEHKQAGRKRQPTAMRLAGEGSASEEPQPGAKFLQRVFAPCAGQATPGSTCGQQQHQSRRMPRCRVPPTQPRCSHGGDQCDARACCQGASRYGVDGSRECAPGCAAVHVQQEQAVCQHSACGQQHAIAPFQCSAGHGHRERGARCGPKLLRSHGVAPALSARVGSRSR